MAQQYDRRMRGINIGVMLVFVVSILAICGLSFYLVIGSLQGERKEPKTNLAGITVSTLIELEDEEAFPDALTIGADGNLYSGSFCTGEIWRITPEGESETFLKKDSGVGAASGMAFSPSGDLFVIDRDDCDPRKSISKIKKIAPDGTVSDFGDIENNEILSSLAFSPDGILYATDTQLGEIRFYTPDGTGATWWELPERRNEARPTGLEYDPVNHALVVADTNNGFIYRVEITPEGQPGNSTEIYEQSSGELDGLTLDDDGNLIITRFDTSEVAMIDTAGNFTILAENFREPSDVAYMDGKIYVANFDGISLAPVVGIFIDPSLPFTIDVVDITEFQQQ